MARISSAIAAPALQTLRRNARSLGILLVLGSGSGCGIPEIPKQLKQTHEDMGQMREAIHLQILDSAFKDLLEAQSPILMFPSAKIFAQEATPDELIEMLEALIADGKQDVDAHDINMAGALATMASEAKWEMIEVLQIKNQNSKINTAYEAGALRWLFTKDYLLASVVDQATLNCAMLAEAAGYFQNMKWILETKNSENFSLSIPSLKIKIQVNPKENGEAASKSLRAFQEKLPKKDLDDKYVQQLLAVFK